MTDAAMLWTGGKDSALALQEARQTGYNIRCLVTFAPVQAAFLAHPLDFIKLQAQAMALPHYVLPISTPYAEAYETSLRRLKDELGIDCVVTGDIAAGDGKPNWIRERSCPVGMNVSTPLWGRDRNALLRQLLRQGFTVRISCVNTRWLHASWVGRELNDAAMAELHSVREQNGLDLCGENGEYHTLVTDGPMFTHRIEIGSFVTHVADSLAYMEIHAAELSERAAV